MIDYKTALRHVKDLESAGLDFPPGEEGIKFLAKSLAKSAHSEEHSRAAINAWISKWPKWPRPADLIQMCEAIPDPHQESIVAIRKSCSRCDGSGWVTVDGPYGTSAAYPCTHQPATEADKRMGVRMHPATAEHYRQLEVEAAPRRAEWVGSGGNVNHKNLQEMFKTKSF